jgi:phage-related protein
MNNNELNIVISAKDKTQEALKSAETSFKNFSGKLEDLQPAFKKMAAVGTVAFGAISAIAITSFKAFSDAQAQTEITNKSLENTLNGFGSGALEKLKTQLGGASDALGAIKAEADKAGASAVRLGIDDETAARSFAKLFSVTKDVSGANKELSLAMDLARFKGISLEEATQKLIMVHSGATKELKMLGLAVDDNATAEQNLDAIHRQVAGSAEAFANTTAGAMERIKVQTDNLKETLGAALAPALNKVLNAVTPIIEKFTAWAQANPELLSKIIMVAGAIAGLVAVVGTLGMVLPPIITGFTLLLSPIGLIIAGVALLAFGIYELITHWDQVVAFFTGIWEQVKLVFNTAITAILGAITKFLTAVSTAWTTGWNAIKGFFKTIWDSILGMVDSAVQGIKNFLQPVIDLISRVISGLQSIGRAVGGGISTAVNWIGNKLGINDGIVQNGKIITTHPDDYIMAAKDPAMFGGGGGVVVNINGGNFLSETAGIMLGDQIIERLKMNLKL